MYFAASFCSSFVLEFFVLLVTPLSCLEFFVLLATRAMYCISGAVIAVQHMITI